MRSVLQYKKILYAARGMPGGLKVMRVRILGVDPGLATVGYGVIEAGRGKLSPVDYGVIETPAHVPLPRRLFLVYKGMKDLIDAFSPHAIAFEELFFYHNVNTALPVGHARGVLLLAAEEAGLPMYEFTPMQIKQATVGYGHAEKKQVQEMVRLRLGLKSVPKPDDAADALAVAICCAGAWGPMIDEEYGIK